MRVYILYYLDFELIKRLKEIEKNICLSQSVGKNEEESDLEPIKTVWLYNSRSKTNVVFLKQYLKFLFLFKIRNKCGNISNVVQIGISTTLNQQNCTIPH